MYVCISKYHEDLRATALFDLSDQNRFQYSSGSGVAHTSVPARVVGGRPRRIHNATIFALDCTIIIIVQAYFLG